MDYRTKNGLPIDFVLWDRDVEDWAGATAGFHLIRIIPFIGGKPVGWMKISYIPQAAWSRVYPTPWHYLALKEGHISLKGYLEPLDLDGLWIQVNLYRWTSRKLEDTTPEERRADLDDYLDHKRVYEKMANHAAFHVDKPLVDNVFIEPAWRNQGILLAMYEFAGRWLARHKGLRLYGSDIRNHEAIHAAWRRFELDPTFPLGYEDFENLLYPEYSRRRLYLDYN